MTTFTNTRAIPVQVVTPAGQSFPAGPGAQLALPDAGTHFGELLFGAYGTIANQALTSGVAVTATYTSAAVNTGTSMDLATGIWTAPRAMTLLVIACIRCQTGIPTRNITTLQKKAADAGSFTDFHRISDAQGHAPTGMIALQVATGDQLRLTAFQNRTTADWPGGTVGASFTPPSATITVAATADSIGGADSFVQLVQLS